MSNEYIELVQDNRRPIRLKAADWKRVVRQRYSDHEGEHEDQANSGEKTAIEVYVHTNGRVVGWAERDQWSSDGWKKDSHVACAMDYSVGANVEDVIQEIAAMVGLSALSPVVTLALRALPPEEL